MKRTLATFALALGAVVARNALTIALASSGGLIRAPIEMTWASLCSRASLASSSS